MLAGLFENIFFLFFLQLSKLKYKNDLFGGLILLTVDFPVVIYSHAYAQSLCFALFSFASGKKRAARSGRWEYNTKHRHTRPLSSPTASKDPPTLPLSIYTVDLEITSHIGRSRYTIYTMRIRNLQ